MRNAGACEQRRVVSLFGFQGAEVALLKSNCSPAIAQLLTEKPFYRCGVSLAGKRVRFEEEMRQNERALAESRSEGYGACIDDKRL